MLKEHEKFRVLDENKINNFFIEANWKGKDPRTNDCKVLRFTFPGGKEAYIKKEYLNAILFALGNEVEQRQLLPQKLSRVRWYETILGIRAEKDIHKGEMINVPVKLSIPSEEEQIIGELRASPAKRKALFGEARTL